MALAFGNLCDWTVPPSFFLSCACVFPGLPDSEWWAEPCIAGSRSQTLGSNHSSLQTQQWVSWGIHCWPQCLIFSGLVAVLTSVTLILENVSDTEVATFKNVFLVQSFKSYSLPHHNKNRGWRKPFGTDTMFSFYLTFNFFIFV